MTFSPHAPSLLSADFIGRWQVARTIVDHHAGTTYSFAGTATVTPEAFEESGKITMGAASFHSHRAYRLRWAEGRVAVAFPEGGLFIELDTRPAQRVVHHCGPDRYEGHFFFTGHQTWVETWRVSGPRKHYHSLSRYRRPA